MVTTPRPISIGDRSRLKGCWSPGAEDDDLGKLALEIAQIYEQRAPPLHRIADDS